MADCKKPNPCPKAERCIHAKDCICADAFRGEYLCFDRGGYDSSLPHIKVSERKGKFVLKQAGVKGGKSDGRDC